MSRSKKYAVVNIADGDVTAVKIRDHEDDAIALAYEMALEQSENDAAADFIRSEIRKSGEWRGDGFSVTVCPVS